MEENLEKILYQYKQPDILIIGGNVVGLLTAIKLRRRFNDLDKCQITVISNSNDYKEKELVYLSPETIAMIPKKPLELINPSEERIDELRDFLEDIPGEIPFEQILSQYYDLKPRDLELDILNEIINNDTTCMIVPPEINRTGKCFVYDPTDINESKLPNEYLKYQKITKNKRKATKFGLTVKMNILIKALEKYVENKWNCINKSR